MGKYFVALSFTILISFFVNSQPAVDGFMKGKSNLDFALGGSFENFGLYFGALNETVPIKRSTAAVNIFMAAGITDWLDVQVNAPYVSTKPEFSGMQDFSSYLKFSILNKYYESGAQLRVMLAVGYSFPMTDYNTENLFSIGQQAEAIESRLIVQVMRSNGFFMMFQGGYSDRQDPVPSSYASTLKVGWAKAERYIDIWYDQQIAVGGNDYLNYSNEIKETGSTDITFTSLGVSYGKIGATYYRPIGESIGFAVGFSQVIWGRNIGQASMLSASLIKKFSF